MGLSQDDDERESSEHFLETCEALMLRRELAFLTPYRCSEVCQGNSLGRDSLGILCKVKFTSTKEVP